jgi:hypothetical protein
MKTVLVGFGILFGSLMVTAAELPEITVCQVSQFDVGEHLDKLEPVAKQVVSVSREDLLKGKSFELADYEGKKISLSLEAPDEKYGYKYISVILSENTSSTSTLTLAGTNMRNNTVDLTYRESESRKFLHIDCSSKIEF